MSCKIGISPYTIKAGDTLYNITQRELGDGSRWTEIKNPDGSLFLKEEVKRLQEGQEICLPLFRGGISKGSFQDMLEALGAFESGLTKGAPNQYQAENTLGFMGKYQFGEPLLIDLSYYKTGVYYLHGADKNYWRGIWTGKKGIDSKSKFLNSPALQEFAILEAFELNWRRINDTLSRQGKSIDDYLGHSKTFEDRGVSKTITITLSGILAAAHLRGSYGVANLLVANQVSHDEFGISILRYMDEYGGYNTTLEDFVNPGS